MFEYVREYVRESYLSHESTDLGKVLNLGERYTYGQEIFISRFFTLIHF